MSFRKTTFKEKCTNITVFFVFFSQKNDFFWDCFHQRSAKNVLHSHPKMIGTLGGPGSLEGKTQSVQVIDKCLRLGELLFITKMKMSNLSFWSLHFLWYPMDQQP